MATFEKRVDAYIAKAEPFAQPILEHLRDLVHRACPDVEETMKWSSHTLSIKDCFAAWHPLKNIARLDSGKEPS